MNQFNYFTDIEETFIRRRGKHLLLSPLDWALIESWQERGIPLRIVLRGIENVFDTFEKNPNRRGTVKSLMYCREEIETQYADWLANQVGKSKPVKKTSVKPKESAQTSVEKSFAEMKENGESPLFSKETIKNHLEHLILTLEKAKANSGTGLRPVLEEVLEELNNQIKSYRRAETLEDALNRLEQRVDRALLKAAEKDELEALGKSIERELAGYNTKMEKEVYRRTFDLMLFKTLREKAGIPPFSLFYL